MKLISKITLLSALLFAFSSVQAATSEPVDPYTLTYSGATWSEAGYTTDVLLGTDVLDNANPETEAAFLAEFLGEGYTAESFAKSDDTGAAIAHSLYQTATQFVVAIDSAYDFTAGYYVAKFGDTSLALRNLDELNNLVFDLSWLPLNKPENAFLGLSHFDLIDVSGGGGGGGGGEVPIPAAVWLFGSALVGLFGAGRKRSNNIA